MLKKIKNTAGNVERRLNKKQRSFSQRYFKNGSNGEPFTSSLTFPMFDVPSIPITDPNYLLANLKILLGAEIVLFSQIENDVIANVLTQVENITKILEKYISKLVSKATTWQPKVQTFEDLVVIAKVSNRSQPVPKSNDTNLWQEYVNLTLLETLATTMANIAESARVMIDTKEVKE